MDWKEHAYLFCNGKFKYKVMLRNPVTLTPYQFPKKDWFTTERANLRLIARKIEDMTDEEWNNISEFHPVGLPREDFELFVNEVALPSAMFLYLLSIGVYPFDQSHFESGEVIDIKTLKKT